jgi:hypothetical protein
MTDPPLDMDHTRNCLNQSIRDAQGRWAGALTLNSSDPDIPFICDKCGLIDKPSYCQHGPCELVAISKDMQLNSQKSLIITQCRNGISQSGPNLRSAQSTGITMFFEWSGRMVFAYRKGCGRVMKSAWEAQDLEWIELVLG